jgi:hypothetical protein
MAAVTAPPCSRESAQLAVACLAVALVAVAVLGAVCLWTACGAGPVSMLATGLLSAAVAAVASGAGVLAWRESREAVVRGLFAGFIASAVSVVLFLLLFQQNLAADGTPRTKFPLQPSEACTPAAFEGPMLTARLVATGWLAGAATFSVWLLAWLAVH